MPEVNRLIEITRKRQYAKERESFESHSMIKVRKTNERYAQSLTIEYDFDKLVAALSASSPSIDVIYQLTSLIKQQNIKSLSSFISQSFQSLLILEQWTWQLFSKDSLRWINEPHYIDLFHTLASFNKTLIYTSDNIENDCKVSLLFPETIDQLNCVFKHIEQIDDENHPYISIINLWFNNHSYFLHDNLQYIALPVIDHIGEYFVRNYMMNRQFKVYLSQLQQPQISQSKILAKMLFYIKTCSFYLYVYLGAKCYNFFYTPEEMIRYLADDYLQIIRTHHRTLESWNTEFLSCMAHLIALTCRCCWWGGESAKMISQTKILLPTEQITYEYIRNLMRIVAHTPLYQKIKTHRSNDETVLLEASLLFIIDTIQTNNINWLFRSKTSYQKILLTVAELSINDVICIAVYHIMGIVLTDEQMKELKMNDGAAEFSFNMLEKAWSHPSKLYKQIPIMDILEGIRNFSKNDSMQQKIADLNKIPLLIEICDQYPIGYDILWALSFNQDIQQQLRSCPKFMAKLANLAQECDNEKMRRVIHGILWNLEIDHEDHSTSDMKDRGTFDIMISYSHKDKILCKQIYDELIKAGYRIWIDFDQMHGNVMDAMAQAIEQSQTIIICMSEDYRKSNYCRAEAHYAFQRQRKIVPILLQKHYKPEGWLLFLIGQLLYIDFTKYDLSQAMTMLFTELKAHNIPETNQPTIQHKEDIDVTIPIQPALTSNASTSLVLSQNILEWSSKDVEVWLIHHDLHQMARLLVGCNGRSLIYLNKYMKAGELQQILKLLQADSLRLTGEDLSLIELSCFRSLMDEQKRPTVS